MSLTLRPLRAAVATLLVLGRRADFTSAVASRSSSRAIAPNPFSDVSVSSDSASP